MIRSNSFRISTGTSIDRLLQRWRTWMVKRYIKKNQNVCDLGCGYEGIFLRKVENIVKKGVGLDIEVKHDLTDTKIKLKEADLAKKLPLEKESFDAVTSLAVVEHLDNYIHYLGEAYRILKPNGLLILTTPDLRGEIILNVLSKLKLIDSGEINDHKRYFKTEQLENVLLGVGFSEIRCKKFQFGFNNLFIAKK